MMVSSNGLHLDQKSFQSLKENPAHIGSQFDKGFGIGGESKAIHVISTLELYFLRSFHPF